MTFGSNQIERHEETAVWSGAGSKKALVNLKMRGMTMKSKVSLLLSMLLFVGASAVFAQVGPAARSGARIGTFVSFGGQKTHVINYTYNSLGVDGGVFIQRSPLIGIEFRAASYPLYARYPQMPVTGGWRFEAVQPGIPSMRVSGYFGAGMSRATDAGAHYVALPAEWAPCWQTSESITFGQGSLSWRPVEATYTQTFTSQRTLSAVSVTTGITYRFNGYRARY